MSRPGRAAGSLKQSTVLFFDIDGVLSIPDAYDGSVRFERWEPGLPVWPIPMADALLRAVDRDPRLHPVWLSAWDRHAWQWNERAGTRRWPVGFYLRPRQWKYALRLFPDLRGVRIDEKLLAVLYYLRRYPDHRIVWIEDGFADETSSWAYHGAERVRLVDTTSEPLHSWLRWSHSDLEGAATAFVNHTVLGISSQRNLLSKEEKQ